MSLEIRPYREDEADAFYRVPSIVFGNYTGQPRSPEASAGMLPDWSLCAFEDGELATAYGAFPFTMRFNGGEAPAAGVSFVGTLPHWRRRGHLRKIMEADFRRRYEQRMQPLAILLASIAAIYQRYGYAVCSSKYRYAIDPRWIGFAPSLPRPQGTWREVMKDDIAVVQEIYRQFIAGRTGYLHRAPIMWEMLLGLHPELGGGEYGASIAAVYEEDGAPRGYVLYGAKGFETHPDGAGPGQRVMVRDYAWLTPGACRAMWEYFKTFDLAARIHVDRAPVDDPAFDIMLDPRELNATRGDWLLGRVIDVERLVPLRRYGREGRAVLDLRDEMCPWNEGRWLIETGGEQTSVRRTNETPDLSLDVSALAQVLFGQVAPSRAVRYGRGEASPNADLARLDAIFRTDYAPFCPDMF